MNQNQSIKQIHDMLVAQVQNLSRVLGETTDPNVAQQIFIEMQEITHRVDLSQNLLFAQGSAALTASLEPIQKANNSLTASIAGIQKAANFVNGAAELLTYVDQALDLAKTLAVI